MCAAKDLPGSIEHVDEHVHVGRCIGQPYHVQVAGDNILNPSTRRINLTGPARTDRTEPDRA